MTAPTPQGEAKDSLLDYTYDQLKFLWRGLEFMLSWHNVFMGMLTIFAIFLVSEKMLNLSFKVEFTIFAAGCIFPTTFSVQAAFQRREKVMQELAHLKANIVALFDNFIFYDVAGKSEAAVDVKPLFAKLADHVEIFCRNEKSKQIASIVNAQGGQRGCDSASHFVYDDFVQICDKLQEHSTMSFGHNGKRCVENTSRSWQYIHDAIEAFECLTAIRCSATPIGLRIFCHFVCNTTCVLLAPFWAHYCKKERLSNADIIMGSKDSGDVDLEGGYGCVSAYLVGLLFTFIVLTLYRVQCELEDPFDGKGDDDIDWMNWKEQLTLVGHHGPSGNALREKGELLKPSSKPK